VPVGYDIGDTPALSLADEIFAASSCFPHSPALTHTLCMRRIPALTRALSGCIPALRRIPAL